MVNVYVPVTRIGRRREGIRRVYEGGPQPRRAALQKRGSKYPRGAGEQAPVRWGATGPWSTEEKVGELRTRPSEAQYFQGLTLYLEEKNRGWVNHDSPDQKKSEWGKVKNGSARPGGEWEGCFGSSGSKANAHWARPVFPMKEREQADAAGA